MQTLEMNLAYRNHVVFFAVLRLRNDIHRSYPRVINQLINVESYHNLSMNKAMRMLNLLLGLLGTG